MASGPITSWQIDGETLETATYFIFLGSKITADGDCSHEIKRCLLFGIKVMTNLDSIFKSRDITLLTKVRLVKAMVFPVVVYECAHLHMKCSLGNSNFLEEISSLFHFIVFLYFFCTIHWRRLSYLSLQFGTLHSDGYIFPFHLSFSLLFFSQLFVRPPQTAILLFCNFFFMGMVLIPVSCTMSQTSIHSSSGTLSIRSSPLNCWDLTHAMIGFRD